MHLVGELQHQVPSSRGGGLLCRPREHYLHMDLSTPLLRLR